jgi:hypothetical protein
MAHTGRLQAVTRKPRQIGPPLSGRVGAKKRSGIRVRLYKSRAHLVTHFKSGRTDARA